MKYFLAIILISLNISIINAQSYEGTIGFEYYVWMDLSLPGAHGEITGSYFYKNRCIPIALKGNKNTAAIDLTEQTKANKITGYFTLKDHGDSLIGKWRNAKGTVVHDVVLYKTDSIYKPKEKIDAGYTNVDSNAEDGVITTSSKRLTFARKNMYTYMENTSTEGYAYPTGEGTWYTLIPNSSTGNPEMLNIWDEIDESNVAVFKKFLNSQIQQCFYETRKKTTDSVWIQLLSGTGYISVDSTYTLDSVFTWYDNGSRKVNYAYYIDSRGLNFYYFDYFHFPHVVAAYDLSCDFVLPFKQLGTYLSKKSVLRRLIDK